MPLRSALKPRPHNLELDKWDSASSPFPFSTSAQLVDSPHVHFPPTPTLTSTALTHSSLIYDRAPIRVAQNSCALPERGARTYFSAESTSPPSPKESYFNPRRSGPIHSMQGWSGESKSLSFVTYDLYNASPTTPSPLATNAQYYNSSDSGAPEGEDGPSSPTAPTSMSATQVSVRLRTISSNSTLQGSSYSSDMNHAEFNATFSLVQPGAKPKAKGVKKKLKESRLQAGESYRRDGAFGSTPDPTLEGCLGGF